MLTVTYGNVLSSVLKINHLLDNANTTMELQDAVSAVVTWRLSNSLRDFLRMHEFAKYMISLAVGLSHSSLSAAQCIWLMTELGKLESHLPVYFTAVAFLHVARISSRHGLNEKLIDVLWAVFEHFQPTSRHHQGQSSTSQLSLSKAVKLMKDVANKSLSTMSLIAIELSKAYLYRALSCEDSDSGSIYCLANVYLAFLYYVTVQCSACLMQHVLLKFSLHSM